MKPEESAALMEQMAQGKAAEMVLEYVNEYAVTARGEIEKRVFAKLEEDGFIEPQIAVQAWAEYHAITQMPKKLRRQSRLGKTAAEKIQKEKIL